MTTLEDVDDNQNLEDCIQGLEAELEDEIAALGRHYAHLILEGIIFTQYNLKQGIQRFGDRGKAAVL
eukprot:CAMPEP_0202452696 /NCGR_PEP_ID=MMETSP1360-20130828/10839_1 /ASSEMBLY_ACC=CAM_ASM_000848 /TAXON_ID=515479 /ORGANISM="Licmophora paradoxa, Strain CCMP2313" /LENGTH=66 /DNA_ID=CAMNT_0049071581 /DNA_START=97 /DNA_END=298 /DNA_ORIENTATION=+